MEKKGLQLFDLTGKNAIVTGASKTTGLCYGMAKALNDAGATVVLMDVSEEVFNLAKNLGGEEMGFYAVQADLTDEATIEAKFNEAVGLLGGRLDILVNGAGIQYRCDAIDFPFDKWMKVIDINLNSVFRVSQLAGKIMLAQGYGRIINIASMTSFFGSKRIPAYAASKGGIMQLTKALSNEWCGKGVNVNAIAPGYMLTEFWIGKTDTEQGRANSARIPAGRWGVAEDLAGVTIFLASDASSYVSGAIIPVDGGYLGA
ncbi:MAG: SDR family oxidoreductase [Bacillota bacterium]